MTLEMIAVIITGASLLVTVVGGMFAGFAWVLRRMDERFHTVDQKFDRIDQRFDTVEERIRGVQTELTEVKVSVARLEGPAPQLILPH